MPPVPTCILSSTQAPQVSHGHDLDRFVQIGSLTKPLTGTLLAQLVEADVLQLDDPLDQFLRIPAGTGITLRHLAEHTAALPRVPPRLRRLDPYADFDLEALNAVLERLDTFTTGPPSGEAEYHRLRTHPAGRGNRRSMSERDFIALIDGVHQLVKAPIVFILACHPTC